MKKGLKDSFIDIRLIGIINPPKTNLTKLISFVATA
jgi:hypothetical protein